MPHRHEINTYAGGMDHNIPLIPYRWEIYVYMYHPHGNEYIEAGRRNCSRLCIPVDIKILYQQDEKVKIKTLLKKSSSSSVVLCIEFLI